MKTIWNFIRARLFRRQRSFMYRYKFDILVQHPALPHALVRVPVTIDAPSKAAARRQLKRELKITVGRAVHAQ